MSALQAWKFLEVALRLGKELKVWSLQNEALLCKCSSYELHQPLSMWLGMLHVFSCADYGTTLCETFASVHTNF